MKSLGASNRGRDEHLRRLRPVARGRRAARWARSWACAITENINEIEAFLTKLTGRAVFPRDVYYFKEIPTNVDPLSVVLVNLGAVGDRDRVQPAARRGGPPGCTRCGRCDSSNCGPGRKFASRSRSLTADSTTCEPATCELGSHAHRREPLTRPTAGTPFRCGC